MKMSGALSVLFLSRAIGDNIKICKTLFWKSKAACFAVPARCGKIYSVLNKKTLRAGSPILNGRYGSIAKQQKNTGKIDNTITGYKNILI
jgi:hypothetical protein